MLIIDVMIDERISLMLKKIMSLLLAPAFVVLSASAAEAEEDFAEELAAIGIEPGKNVDNETDIIVTPINTETERSGRFDVEVVGYPEYKIDLIAGIVTITAGKSS